MNILLAEDHNVVRNGIRMLLETDNNIAVIAEATNGLEVLSAMENGMKVDIVLTDINMPEMDGLSLTKALMRDFPEVLVIILSMHDNENYITEAFREGASGYILKSVSSEELIFSIKHIFAGNKYLCAELTMKMVDKLLLINELSDASDLNSNSGFDISLREIEVLNLIAEGMTNAEMADQLFISKRTIEGHRQSLIEKTGVRNTASLIKYAVLHGFIK